MSGNFGRFVINLSNLEMKRFIVFDIQFLCESFQHFIIFSLYGSLIWMLIANITMNVNRSS